VDAELAQAVLFEAQLAFVALQFPIVAVHDNRDAEALDDGTVINVSGTGSWKNLAVTNPSKEVIVDKKFYKSGFGDVMQDPETGPWVSAMLEKALVKSSVTAADVDIDPESYEDVRALADQLTDASLDVFPE
jgi:hypothetical protein